MLRNAKISKFDLNFDNYIQKNESLIIQLCEHIFKSGFVFQDATENEIEAGEWVIRDFFDQHFEVFFELVPRHRLGNFFDYLKNFDLSFEELKKKLHQRILKVFDILSIGHHHHFNIRQNIAKGLNKKDQHPLYDLLLYIETYYNLVLKSNLTTKKFNLEDLKKLRSTLQNRLLGKDLVKRFLRKIAIERSVTYESLIYVNKKNERKYPHINFVEPAYQPLKRKRKDKSKDMKKLIEIKNNPDVVKLSIKPDSDYDKNKLQNKVLKNLEQNLIKSDSENGNGSKKEFKINKNFLKKHKELTKENISLTENADHTDGNSFFNPQDNDSIYSGSYDSDVVFGNKKITQFSMEAFVMEYPDSALKFIINKNLDGRPLVPEIEDIYYNWSKRGLSKSNLKKYVFEIMEWNEFPNLSTIEILKKIREKIYEISKN